MTQVYGGRPVVLRGLFSHSVHEELQRFVKHDAPNLGPISDELKPDNLKKFYRKSLHNTPALVGVHQQLTDFASSLFGCRVKPSYCFLSMYEPGGQCYLHRDREQCLFTIDYLISQESPDPWPITISDRIDDAMLPEKRDVDSVDEMNPILLSNNWTTCFARPNDAVCYSGTHAWHYRPTKSVGNVNLVFFHFVREDYNGPLD